MSATPRLWSFRASPFAGRVRVAFAEKDVPYELLEIHPARRPARLRELNPVNRVPVLEVDGVAIRESSIILEWLEETHPDPPLWPRDAALRGWARGWAKFIDGGASVNFFLGMRKLAFGSAPDDPQDIVARLHAKVPEQWQRIEPVLGVHDGPWLCGEQLTYADVAAMAVAVRIPEWAPALAPDPAATPRVAAWLQALRERPSSAAIDAAGEPVVA
jgi:glutathione S-transferase